MKFIDKIKGIVSHDNFACNNCGFRPENPKDEFSINRDKTRMSSDFSYYDCPSCSDTFQAIFCDCGRGYTSRMDFSVVKSPGQHGGQENYHCNCGELLHQHHRY